MKTKALSIVPALFLGLGLLACSGGNATTSESGVTGDGVDLTGKADMFPGFTLDTGLQPSGSPVQAELIASVAGALNVSARGAKQDGKLSGVAGSGKLAIDLHAKLDGKLKIAAGTIDYDGPIPGLDKIDVPIAADVVFDPFLLGDGDKASVDANVPPADLPPIPLDAVGVPGTLNLKVKEGSTVHADLHGACIQSSGGKATYAGATQTSGTIVLGASVKVDLPIGGDVDLPDITMKLPALAGTISAGGDASGLADFQDGAACAGASPPSPASSSDGGSTSSSSSGGPPAPSSSDGGAKTCADPTPISPAVLPWNPPAAPQAGACTEAELAAFDTKASTAASDDDLKSAVSAKCAACIFADSSLPWSPLPEAGGGQVTINIGGCYATMTGSVACGKAIQNDFDCNVEACSSCADAASQEACITNLDAPACATEAAAITSACGGVAAATWTKAGDACQPSTEMYMFDGLIRVACIAKP